MLDGKEEDLRAMRQELESARGEERALQGRLEQERLQRLRTEAQNAQALGVSAAGPAGAGSHSSGSSRLGDLCSDSVVAAMRVSPHRLQPFDCAGQTDTRGAAAEACVRPRRWQGPTPVHDGVV